MNRKTFSTPLLYIAAAALCLAGPAHAADDTDGWHYEGTFYAWAKSIKGTSGDTKIDLDFLDDIVDMLDGAFMVSLEAERGDWSFYGAFEYSDIGDDARIERTFDYTLPPPIGVTVPITAGSKVEFEEQEYIVDVGVGWAFSESDDTRWRLLGGAKWFKYDTEVKLGEIKLTGPGGVELPSVKGRKVDHSEDWWLPYLGVAVRTQLSDTWRLRARGDYGRRDSDNTSWMLEALFDWRFNDWGALEMGYRYMEIDYDSGGSDPYIYDVEMKGPVIGLIVRF
jgi:opacity protein-like surface antigen